MLKPDRIDVVQAPTTPEYCKMGRNGAHGCTMNVAAAAPTTDIGRCRAAPESGSLLKKQAC
jgi:hypothetical protein